MTERKKMTRVKRFLVFLIATIIIVVVGTIGYLVYSYCSEPHTHSYKVVDNVDNVITTKCKCGDYIITDMSAPMCAHKLQLDIVDERHIIKCTKCAYEVNEAHRYELCSDGEVHYEKCTLCDTTRNEEAHSFTNWNFNANEHYAVCDKCNKSFKEVHQYMGLKENDSVYTKCKTCDYVGAKSTSVTE